MTDEELKKLLAEYRGPVKRCPPGEARGKRVKPLPVKTDRPVNVRHERKTFGDDEAGRWLCEHDRRIRKRCHKATEPITMHVATAWEAAMFDKVFRGLSERRH